MAYVDYSSHWVLDQFLTYLEANVLGSNDEHLYDTFAVEHNINTSTIDGTHKTNSITGSSINTTPASTGTQTIIAGLTWTPTVGIYQIVDTSLSISALTTLSIYVSGSWRSGGIVAVNSVWNMTGIYFFDGTNMRLFNNGGSNAIIYYQKF